MHLSLWIVGLQQPRRGIRIHHLHFRCLHHFFRKLVASWGKLKLTTELNNGRSSEVLGKKILCRCSSCREKPPVPGGLMSSCSGCKCQTEHQRQPENWKLWGWWNYQIIHTWNNQADDILRIGYDCHDSHVDSAARRQIWRGGAVR